MATLPGTWLYGVCAGSDWPGQGQRTVTGWDSKFDLQLLSQSSSITIVQADMFSSSSLPTTTLLPSSLTTCLLPFHPPCPIIPPHLPLPYPLHYRHLNCSETQSITQIYLLQTPVLGARIIKPDCGPATLKTERKKDPFLKHTSTICEDVKQPRYNISQMHETDHRKLVHASTVKLNLRSFLFNLARFLECYYTASCNAASNRSPYLSSYSWLWP